jgi:hypothetical protein
MKLKDLFDSSPKSTDKWSRYFDVYQRYLEKYEGKNITFIEVGVQNGGSMEMWSKFFGPESKLYGIDIDPKCAELKYDNPNVNIIIGDQESKEFWDTILPSIGPIDVFIDDGGHFIPQQIVTFEKVWNKIKRNGVYICEDTHTSYFQRFNSSYKSQNSFIEYAKDFADILHLKKTDQYNSLIGENISNIIRSNENLVKKEFAHDLSSIHFYDSMIVIEKDEIVPMERIVHAGVI